MTVKEFLHSWWAHLVGAILIVTPQGIELELGMPFPWIPFLSVPLAGLLLSFKSPPWLPLLSAVATLATVYLHLALGTWWTPGFEIPVLLAAGMTRESYQGDWMPPWKFSWERWKEALGWPAGGTIGWGVSLALNALIGG